jgi:hypothetical protein
MHSNGRESAFYLTALLDLRRDLGELTGTVHTMHRDLSGRIVNLESKQQTEKSAWGLGWFLQISQLPWHPLLLFLVSLLATTGFWKPELFKALKQVLSP